MYDTPSGLDAIHPAIALKRKELEQNNVQPGQEADYFQSKGIPLSPEILHLIQMNKILQQQGQVQQQGAPAPTTVAQDMQQKLQQAMQARQPQPQPQPQPPPQAMPPQMDPRQQGVAQLPQQAVGQQKGMAAGGIIAFSGEGRSDVQSDDNAESGDGDISFEESLAGRAWPYVKGAGTLLESATGLPRRVLENTATFGQNVPAYLFGGKTVPYPNAFGTPAAPRPRIGTTYEGPGEIRFPGGPTSAAELKAKLDKEPAAAPAAQPAWAPPLAAATKSKDYADSMTPLLARLQTEADRDTKSRIAELEELDKKSGLTALQQKKLDRLKADETALTKDRKRDLGLGFAAAAFGSVGKNRNLAAGLGKMGAGFAENAIKVNQKYKDAKTSLQEAQEKAEEARAMGDVTRFKQAQADQDKARDKLDSATVEKIKLQQTGQGQQQQHEYQQGMLRSHAEDTRARFAEIGENAAARAQALKGSREGQLATEQARLAIAAASTAQKLQASPMYADLLDAARKAQKNRDQQAYETAMKSMDELETRTLAPIQREMDRLSGGSSGGNGKMVSFDSLK